ncbi:MAG TPA: hypothetical protein VI670_10830 [Thermoanaerobaculia bacterium]
MSETAFVDPKAVFINAPFDSAYEPLFVTLIGMTTFLDYRPHCVLEVRETGEGRLQRIYDLMRTCRISLHDMSRIGTPARFNMPFELGLACSLKLREPDRYEIRVLDSKEYRLDQRLSDYKGRDLFIHRDSSDGMIAALLDAFQAQQGDASIFRGAVRRLRISVAEMKRESRANTIFHPYLFARLASTAIDIATRYGLLAP